MRPNPSLHPLGHEAVVVFAHKRTKATTGIHYRAAKVDGRNVFYRETGAPKLFLLHGFPTSSHMFRDLIPRLADRFHIVAPDLPGFGNSDMPDNTNTFDRIAETIDRFTETIGFDHYAVYVFDYGAPTGFRLAAKYPDRITAIISQNGNADEEGLSGRMESDPRLLAGYFARKPGGAARLPEAGDDRVAIYARCAGPDEGLAGRLLARQLLPRPAGRR
jgi:pimeloyl-ACP methyl ester carboxylesterase